MMTCNARVDKCNGRGDTQDMTITCERCGRTTTDPDKWDPEAETGRIFCDGCWDHRNEPVHLVTITDGGGRFFPRCAICGPLPGQDYEGDAEAVAARHEEIGGFEG